jgi:hypothetical protein
MTLCLECEEKLTSTPQVCSQCGQEILEHCAEQEKQSPRYPGYGEEIPGSPFNLGQVISLLKPDFPTVSLSKIRYFVSEGLLGPDSSSGFKKFSSDDVNRLRYALTAQRDQYLPLRIIKEHLGVVDHC